MVTRDVAARPHDHVDLVFSGNSVLRLNDPRRFGSIHWQAANTTHWLLSNVGPEPFSNEFNGDYLFSCTRRRRTAIKTVLMDSHVVAGIGNIYANEALFRAGIRPRRNSSRTTRKECQTLVRAVQTTLSEALRAGGTTLRDYEGVNGDKGYFKVSLLVYGREGLPCHQCNSTIKRVNLAQRQTVYCPTCQS